MNSDSVRRTAPRTPTGAALDRELKRLPAGRRSQIVNHSRHLIRYVAHIHRDPIFRDLFAKLASSTTREQELESSLVS